MDLPREIREKIYEHTLCQERWWIGDEDGPTRWNFARALGDPSGYYFSFGKDVALLKVSRQVRQEALPLAYRKTTFHLADMDDLTRLLLAIGRVGRENIQCLEFIWESRIDLEYNRWKFPDLDGNQSKLPSLHVPTCVQLIKQCTRLKFLRPRLESFIMTNIPESLIDNSVGILSLCSISTIEKLEVLCFDDEKLEDCNVLKLLKDEAAERRLLRSPTNYNGLKSLE